MDLWKTRCGWIFCLNAEDDSNGSNWGYTHDFVISLAQENNKKSGHLVCESPVWGKVCFKDGVLRAGDGLAFYHGKKARREIGSKSRVNPYQITMLAEILDVQQSGTQIEFIRFCIPQKLFLGMSENPIVKNEEVGKIIASSGLGGGRVGTYFPLDPPAWSALLSIAKKI